MTLQEATRELLWRDVPKRAIALAEKCADVAVKARRATRKLDQDGFLELWYNPDTDTLKLNVGDWISGENMAAWKAALRPLAANLETIDEAGGPGKGSWEQIASRETLKEKFANWVKIAERPPEARAFVEKRAVSPTLSALATAGGYKAHPSIPIAPNPMTSMLASGLLGTGAGYGLGFMAEHLMPETWEKGKLRRSGAILGGLAGAALPGAWMAANVYQGDPWYKGHPTGPNPNTVEQLGKIASQSGYTGPWSPINVPGFTQALWDDPRVRDRVPVHMRAGLTGIVEGASSMRDGASFVTPLDIARIAAGMGVGYVSGGLVGKVLGALTGLPEQTQETLKNTGMYAGIVNAVAPMLF